MKNGMKKTITATIVVGILLVPTIASAASSYLTGGYSYVSRRTHVGWADYEHHSVNATLRKYDVIYSSSGWSHCRTAALNVETPCNIFVEYGYNGQVYGTTSGYQS